MKRAGINVKLNRHARLDEPLRVLDILVDKKIKRANWNVGRRQIAQIGSPRRRRVRRYVRSTSIAAEVSFPAQVVGLAIPHPRIGNRVTGRCNVAVIYHWVDEELESDLHFATVAGQQRQPRTEAAPAAGASDRDTRWIDAKLACVAKQPL